MMTSFLLDTYYPSRRVAVRGEHVTSSSSSIHERIGFVVYTRIVRSRVYTKYAYDAAFSSRTSGSISHALTPRGCGGCSTASLDDARLVRLWLTVSGIPRSF